MYEVEEVLLNTNDIERMIERCYSVDQYIIVRNSGNCYAKLKYGEYIYQNTRGEYTKELKLIQLKDIFLGLINKYNSFEHQGYKYYRSRGEWTKMKLPS